MTLCLWVPKQLPAQSLAHRENVALGDAHPLASVCSPAWTPHPSKATSLCAHGGQGIVLNLPGSTCPWYSGGGKSAPDQKSGELVEINFAM